MPTWSELPLCQKCQQPSGDAIHYPEHGGKFCKPCVKKLNNRLLLDAVDASFDRNRDAMIYLAKND